MEKRIAHNIKVEHILQVLKDFKPGDYIDITLVPGEGNQRDVIRINPSSFSPPQQQVQIKEWFDFKRLNDFI